MSFIRGWDNLMTKVEAPNSNTYSFAPKWTATNFKTKTNTKDVMLGIQKFAYRLRAKKCQRSTLSTLGGPMYPLQLAKKPRLSLITCKSQILRLPELNCINLTGFFRCIEGLKGPKCLVQALVSQLFICRIHKFNMHIIEGKVETSLVRFLQCCQGHHPVGTLPMVRLYLGRWPCWLPTPHTAYRRPQIPTRCFHIRSQSAVTQNKATQ